MNYFDDVCALNNRTLTHHIIFSEFGRDVVSYAMSYFDRIFPYYSINDTLVELVALTCLYLALKIHCSNKISLRCILSFSGSSFQYDQVLKMERIILRGLDWHLHPATPHSFLEIFFSTSSSDDKEMNEIEETANYLLELAICDAFFVSKKASCVSSAAILAAMDIVRRPLRVNAMMENLLVNNDRCMVEACSKRLKEIYTIMIKQSSAQELGAVNSDSPISVVNVA